MKVRKSWLPFVFLFLFSIPIQAETWKILEVNSYNSDWLWIEQQHSGFLKGMGNVDLEIKVVDLDSKNVGDSEIHSRVMIVENLIQSWKPDLIYLTDDRAQSEVAIHHLNGSIPLVFSGVNKSPADYGFDKSSMVTGVLEIEHFLSTANLLKEILGKDNLNLAIVIDDDPTWIGVSQRIKDILHLDQSITVTRWLQPETFEDFKKEILSIEDDIDGIGMLGVFRFLGDDGAFVDYEQVLKWTVENSPIPDFSFWDTRIERGTLCAVTVSGYEQGELAGSMARRILVNGVNPSSIEMVSSSKGQPMISLARGRQLNLKIKVDLLLNSKILTDFIWGN